MEHVTQRLDILGVPVDNVTMQDALNKVDEYVRGDECKTIIAVNPEKIIKAQKSDFLFNSLKNAGLLIPDGIGVVLAARIFRLAKMERVAGSELMPAICKDSVSKGYKLYLYGAAPKVCVSAVTELRRRHPGIQITGYSDGYVKDQDMNNLIDDINQSQAQILFIALGSPGQELWMNKHMESLSHVRVCQGVGGTFDVLAGNVKRAPKLFLRLNLEWLYRLLTNPKRLIRQTALPKFIIQVFRKKLLIG